MMIIMAKELSFGRVAISTSENGRMVFIMAKENGPLRMVES